MKYSYIKNRKEEFYVSLAFIMPCLTCFIIDNIVILIVTRNMLIKKVRCYYMKYVCICV